MVFFYLPCIDLALSGRIGQLSLESGNVSVLLQDYEKRKEGAQLQLDVSKRGAIEKLRQLVSKQEQCEPARVRFYMYAVGSIHRIHIDGDSMLFANWPIRTLPLFYSVVEEGHLDPPSPEEEMRKIKEKIQESDRRIRRLEMNSSTAGIRDRVFSECVEVSFEDWKKRLGNEGGDYSHALAQIFPNAQCKIVRKGEIKTCSELNHDKEDVVQAFFVRSFLLLE